MNENDDSEEAVAQFSKSEFADACDLLDVEEEQNLTEIGTSADLRQWPEY